MDRLFFDTNVLLDVLEHRSPWFPESAECLARVKRGNCAGALSALSLSDIAYIQKTCSPVVLCDAFLKLRHFLDVAPLTAQSVDAALLRQMNDIEDSFQLEAALHWNATHLITRNVKDFPSDPPIAVMSPADYLRSR